MVSVAFLSRNSGSAGEGSGAIIGQYIDAAHLRLAKWLNSDYLPKELVFQLCWYTNMPGWKTGSQYRITLAVMDTRLLILAGIGQLAAWRHSCSGGLQVTRSWTEARRQSNAEAGPSTRPEASSQILPAVESLVAADGGRWLAAVGPTQIHIIDLDSQQHHAQLPLPQVCSLLSFQQLCLYTSCTCHSRFHSTRYCWLLSS